MYIINKRPVSIKYFLGPLEMLNENLYLLHKWEIIGQIFGLNLPWIPQTQPMKYCIINYELE